MSLEWLAILLVFALLLLWFLGPRIIIDETVQSVQYPKNLNHYPVSYTHLTLPTSDLV